jgi:hypothetical protein
MRWFLAWLVFDPEDGGDTFLKNVGYHCAISEKIAAFITTAVRPTNPKRKLPVSEVKNDFALFSWRLYGLVDQLVGYLTSYGYLYKRLNICGLFWHILGA